MTTFAESCNDREMQRPRSDKLETAQLLQILRKVLRRFMAVFVSSAFCKSLRNMSRIFREIACGHFPWELKKEKIAKISLRFSPLSCINFARLLLWGIEFVTILKGAYFREKLKGNKKSSQHCFTLFGNFPRIFTLFQSFSEFFLHDFCLELRGLLLF